jgi:hypothetical protein
MVSHEIITALMWYYGWTKTEATKQLKIMDSTSIALIVQTFKDNAKESFKED